MSEIEHLLATSRVSEPFKEAVRGYFATGRAELIQVEGRAPRIKIRRVLSQLLHAAGELPIERIAVQAQSGCSDFVGTVQLETTAGPYAFEFVWDCRWKAQQEGWTDYFGLPDQIRAAQEFDWRCFQRWELAGASSAADALAGNSSGHLE